MKPKVVSLLRMLSVGQSYHTCESAAPTGMDVPWKEAHMTATLSTSCLLQHDHCTVIEQMSALPATGRYP